MGIKELAGSVAVNADVGVEAEDLSVPFQMLFRQFHFEASPGREWG